MQWEVVAELRDGDMGEQARPWPPALDGQRGHRRLHDRLAGTAAQLRPHMADHLEAGGMYSSSSRSSCPIRLNTVPPQPGQAGTNQLPFWYA